MDTFIKLPYGGKGAGFYASQLIAHIRSTGRDYIIQGQQKCTLKRHTKPNSLDVWLRKGFTNRQDRKQADNQVIQALVDTGQFEVDEHLLCPDSGRRVKGLRLLNPSGGKTTMPIYEKPAWQLMRDDMVKYLEIKKGDIFSREEVLAWFDKHYPDIKSNTVSQQLRRLSTNARSRINYTIKPEEHDVFFQVDGSNFRLYDPESDPLPIYPGPKQPKKVAALDEITDEALRKRIEPLFRLPSLPLDTIVREASVVLEHRLRAVVGANSSLTGVNLVEAVLNKEKGALIFSSHPAEQDGVRMLYRGAMQFIRNPPMHKLMEYSEDTARLLIRLIDSLLQLLSEGEPRQVE